MKEQESRSRRARKPKQHAEARELVHWSRSPAQPGIGADHPILKRKRVQRDLSSVIFGPNTMSIVVHWS